MARNQGEHDDRQYFVAQAVFKWCSMGGETMSKVTYRAQWREKVKRTKKDNEILIGCRWFFSSFTVTPGNPSALFVRMSRAARINRSRRAVLRSCTFTPRVPLGTQAPNTSRSSVWRAAGPLTEVEGVVCQHVILHKRLMPLVSHALLNLADKEMESFPLQFLLKLICGKAPHMCCQELEFH